MVDTENAVIAGFVAVAFVLYLALTSFTELSFPVILAVVVAIGLVAPQVLLKYGGVGDRA